MGLPEGEEREQGIENLFEKIMTENFPNLVKKIDIQVQEAQRVPNKMNQKRCTPRHIIKQQEKKQLVTYKGATIRMSADFSETSQARGDWQETFNVKKSKDLYIIKITLLSKAIS